MNRHFKLAGAGLMGIAAAVVAACGGSSTTTTVVETSGGGSPASGTATPGGGPLKPPSGADPLKTSVRNGVEYARYS
ncbi:MAG: hypothetical protein ACKOTH_06470, partial [Solirubrobacterales bacterium]